MKEMREGDGDRRKVVQLGGLEPPTSGSTIRRSNQLSYSCTRLAWQAGRTLGTTPVFGKRCLFLVAALTAPCKRKTRATGPGSIVFAINSRRRVGLRRPSSS